MTFITSFFCHNSADRSLFVKCVVKVNIFVLLNHINLPHESFQLEFGALLPFINGYFSHEPLVVKYVVDITNAIFFYDSDTWRPPPNNHIFWNSRVSFNSIIHSAGTWRTWCTTVFLQPPPDQWLLLPDAAYRSFETTSIFPLQAWDCMNDIVDEVIHGGRHKLAELGNEFCRRDSHCVRNWLWRYNLNVFTVRDNLYVVTSTIFVAMIVISQQFSCKHTNSFKSCSSPRWDILPSGHQRYPLLGINLGYMYWGQKHSSE